MLHLACSESSVNIFLLQTALALPQGFQKPSVFQKLDLTSIGNLSKRRKHYQIPQSEWVSYWIKPSLRTKFAWHISPMYIMEKDDSSLSYLSGGFPNSVDYILHFSMFMRKISFVNASNHVLIYEYIWLQQQGGYDAQ